jgi:hypothetical protein
VIPILKVALETAAFDGVGVGISDRVGPFDGERVGGLEGEKVGFAVRDAWPATLGGRDDGSFDEGRLVGHNAGSSVGADGL